MSTRARRAPSQSGSAYLLAILVLLILTMVGLALTLTTQSEARIGENERVLRRSFYTADAGLAIGTAKALALKDLDCLNLDLAEPSENPELQIRNRLRISDFKPVQKGWCNLCQVNQGSPFEKVNHAVTAASTRVGWKGDPDNPPLKPTPLAEDRLSVMVSFQPWEAEITSAVKVITGGGPDGGFFVDGAGVDNLCGLQEGF